MAYRQIGLVTIRCRECGADLGTFLYGGISTAICIKCQRLQEEIEKNKDAPMIQPVVHQIPGEAFTIVTQQQVAAPVAKEESGFDKEAKNLFTRAKKAVTQKKRK